VTAAGAAGCGAAAGATARLQLAAAYVPVPRVAGTTIAYVVIRNNGPADRLVAARTSVGGHVAFRVPAAAHSVAMRTVGSIGVRAHSTLAMAPDTYQLLITGAGPMPGGKAITLTLVFAQAGPVSISTQVINPESGGSSYFLN
jgi:copper(I)-binding protein